MIYLIRHGEAAAKWGDHPDPGLSEAGQDQAETVAQSLLKKGVEHIITSPMARCQATAAAFAGVSGLEARVEPRVTEIPTPADVNDRVPWLRALMSGNWADAPALVQDWRRELIGAVADLPDHTAVFTHFVAINGMVSHLEGVETVTTFRPNYCSVTTLDREMGELKLVARGESLETRVL